MSELSILIRQGKAVADPLPARVDVVVSYRRLLPPEDDQTITSSPAKRVFALPTEIEADFTITDYEPGTLVDLTFANGQGIPIFTMSNLEPVVPQRGESPTLTITLTPQQIEQLREAMATNEPDSANTLKRNGRFVTIGFSVNNIRNYALLVSPIQESDIDGDTLSALFDITEFRTVAKQIPSANLSLLSNLQLAEIINIPVGLNGQFQFTAPIIGGESGWFWILSGAEHFAGIQQEADLGPKPEGVTIILTRLAGEPDTPTPSNGNGVPIDVVEGELLENPDLFNDDPGSYCRPFSNPNRIIGERAFHTILRVKQPEIGGEPSVPSADDQPPFAFSPEWRYAAPQTDGTDVGLSASAATPIKPVAGLFGLIAAGYKTDPTNPILTTRAAQQLRRRWTIRNSQGRRSLSINQALDWEGDSTVYQATTLGLGHVLEFRVRWRSNGYSLGDVAHTLTLAPRQVKRIITIQSSITDRIERRETTQVAEQVEQETSRDYSYSDTVEAHLSEWAKGHSEAKTTGVAGGVGFALSGFVIGGGAAHGRSSSDSWQQGGRNVSAGEEQQLRDAIRQYGESLRRLDSMVVVEQSQEEFVQGVSEIVRNPNYCHSLTVIYHEILRHLRIDTEVVGARECVFVPLAIKPFNLERVVRWRDVLERRLRKRRLRWVMRYLQDVATNFSSSAVPPGPRSTHPIEFVTGSIFVQLAIERPKEDEEGNFVEINWLPVSPFLGTPPLGIFSRLIELAEARRDAVFQKDYAPTVAAKWLDSLELRVNSGPLEGADFTMASSYAYNRTVRVDFTYNPPAGNTLTRGDLEEITVLATSALPGSSVANVKNVQIQYYTETFDRRASSRRSTSDLINVESGEPDPSGAMVILPLSRWETRNMQAEIIKASEELIGHLNEHIEYYHKIIWWSLDRDKLYMMLDSILVLGAEDGRSVASVVERNPIAIMGNSLVYRVASGAFLGVDSHESPAALNDYYRDNSNSSEPIRVSLPTSGVYAQAIMDECMACEEHNGSTDWVLSDNEPELEALGPDALRRRATLPDASPTDLPSSIINLQNAPNVPPPSGLAGVLGAVQNAGAFRDMAGLEGTQANARAAMETAANLATQFGSQAADLRKAEMATDNINRKLASIKKAHDNKLISDSDMTRHANQALGEMNTTPSKGKLSQEKEISEAIRKAGGSQGGKVSVSRTDKDGTQKVEVEHGGKGGYDEPEPDFNPIDMDKILIVDGNFLKILPTSWVDFFAKQVTNNWGEWRSTFWPLRGRFPDEPDSNVDGLPIPTWIDRDHVFNHIRTHYAAQHAALTEDETDKSYSREAKFILGRSPSEPVTAHYFVIHDTDGTGEHVNGDDDVKKGNIHLWIGTVSLASELDWHEEGDGTKLEGKRNSCFVHIELTNHTRKRSEITQAAEDDHPSDTISTARNAHSRFTIQQYDDLANAYIAVSLRAGYFLTVTAHREVDRGVKARNKSEYGHNDPRDFDIDFFYELINKKLHMPSGTTYGIQANRIAGYKGKPGGCRACNKGGHLNEFINYVRGNAPAANQYGSVRFWWRYPDEPQGDSPIASDPDPEKARYAYYETPLHNESGQSFKPLCGDGGWAEGYVTPDAEAENEGDEGGDTGEEG